MRVQQERSVPPTAGFSDTEAYVNENFDPIRVARFGKFSL